MGGRRLRVAMIAGIPVGISPWWLLIVALLTASLSAGYFPGRVPGIGPAAAVGLALASVLLVFAGVLAHEFAHALVARRHGVVIDEIDLWLLGGVARMRNQPRRPGDELRFALAGPALTAVLALAFGAAAWALRPSAPAALRAFVDYQLQVNLAIAGFNLLPALPLDGGRAARALAWKRTGDLQRATVAAARAGRAIGFALIYLGAFAVILGVAAGLWMALLGGFLIVAATGEQRVAELEAALAGLTAEDVMSTPAVAVSEDLPSVAPDESTAALLERPAFLRIGRAVVVDAARRPLGVVSLSDLQGRVPAASGGPAHPRDQSPPEVTHMSAIGPVRRDARAGAPRRRMPDVGPSQRPLPPRRRPRPRPVPPRMPDVGPLPLHDGAPRR
jgi:Zn-dependent protease